MRAARWGKSVKIIALLMVGAVAGVLIFLSQLRSMNAGARLSDGVVAALVARAEKGDSAAAWQLVSHFEYGMEDMEKADYWMQRAAELGNAKAQMNLYDTYRRSSDPQLRAKAESFLIRAAEGSDGRAQLMLAQRYFIGDEVRVDFVLGETWLRRAAKSGEPVAQNQLSVMLLALNSSDDIGSLVAAYAWSNRVVAKYPKSMYAEEAKCRMAFLKERARRLGMPNSMLEEKAAVMALEEMKADTSR